MDSLTIVQRDDKEVLCTHKKTQSVQERPFLKPFYFSSNDNILSAISCTLFSNIFAYIVTLCLRLFKDIFPLTAELQSEAITLSFPD